MDQMTDGTQQKLVLENMRDTKEAAVRPATTRYQ